MKISVILPVFDEEEIISKTIEKVLDFSKKHKNYNFIFVNDGSTDNTLETLIKMIGNKGRKKRIAILSYPKNKGKGYAIRKGVECADGDYICFLDSDLAYSLDHLPIIYKELKNDSDIVIGCRGLILDNIKNISLIRKISGAVFNFFARTILGLKFRDMQAGLKGFEKSVAKELFRLQRIIGWSFDVELIYLAKKKGFIIKEIPVKVSNSHSYKISKIKLFKDSIKMFCSLLQIKINDLLGRYNG